jgi:FPC/CPF motif-containing protein YcgG
MQTTTSEPTTSDPARSEPYRGRFGLWNKTTIEHAQMAPWQTRAYASFTARVTDPLFPCFFATKAQREGRLLYSFAESTEQPKELLKIYIALLGYLDQVDHLSGIDRIMATLILFIKPVPQRSVENYVAQAWTLIQFLHNHDIAPWPGNVPTDPDQASWSFCFDGTPLFVNISSPAHHQRKSRNLGEALTLVIQPREGFDIVAGDTENGQHVRKIIRDRIAAHDHIAPSPELGNYGDVEKREWRQYGLSDTNDVPAGICPFRAKGASHG